MKKLILISVAVFCTLFNTAALCAGSGFSRGVIKTIHWYEGHSGVLIIQDGMSDLGGCGRTDYYILDDSHAYFKEIYALILIAHASGQPLTIEVKDCVQGISRIRHVSSTKS
ncbi:MAG: hypothetical protein IV107_25140 [Paucibacter sp.]|nr:hypothetical protein [Roseateles sp.]